MKVKKVPLGIRALDKILDEAKETMKAVAARKPVKAKTEDSSLQTQRHCVVLSPLTRRTHPPNSAAKACIHQ